MHEPVLLSRPFGHAPEDLEVDFGHGDRPTLVTELLARCAQPADATHWWHRPVGRRVAALLALLQATDHRAGLTPLLPCAEPGCGERFEVELPHVMLDDLACQVDDDEPVAVTRDGAAPLLLRRPTGDDLRAWQTGVPLHGGDPRDAMLQRLCLAGEPQAGDAVAAAQALAEADPLVAFHVHCACPACGHAADHAVDLEGLALRALARRQHELFEEVHLLASCYGWTEHEILAVGPARRARYVAMIEGAA